MTYNVFGGTLNPTLLLLLSSDRFRQLLKTELISTLPLSTHSAVEMLHDSVLYKFTIDIDIKGDELL